MKKSLIFISVLLCITLAFISCNDSNSESAADNGSKNNIETTSDINSVEESALTTAETSLNSNECTSETFETEDNALPSLEFEDTMPYIERDSQTGNIYAVWATNTFLLPDVTYTAYLESVTYGQNAWIFNFRAQGITLYKLSVSGEMEIYENIYPEDVGFTEMTFAFASFTNENHGYIFFWRDDCYMEGWPIQFLKTLDGGKTWEMIQSNDSTSAGDGEYYPELAKFLNEDIGIVTYRYEYGPSDCGQTYITSDGGKTWKAIYDLPYPDEVALENTYSKLVDAYWDEFDNSLRIEVKVISQFVEYTLKFKSYNFEEWVLY